MAKSSCRKDGRPAPGFTFAPADHVLIKLLRSKVAGQPVDERLNIHDADAYSASPDDLVANREDAPGTDKHDGNRGDWYFFTSARRHDTRNGGGRRQRAVGEGYTYTWHTEGREVAVLDDDDHGRRVRVGYRRKLSYGFKESPGAKLTRLGWCMTEFRLDGAAADDLVLCKVCVSRHKTETTYASVMKATADSKKRKAGDDPHPDAPRPQTPRRHEMDLQELHEMERWLNSDEDDAIPAGAAGDGSVDPAGFFDDILDVQDFCGPQQSQDEEVGGVECTYADLFGDDDMDEQQSQAVDQECTYEDLFGDDDTDEQQSQAEDDECSYKDLFGDDDDTDLQVACTAPAPALGSCVMVV